MNRFLAFLVILLFPVHVFSQNEDGGSVGCLYLWSEGQCKEQLPFRSKDEIHIGDNHLRMNDVDIDVKDIDIITFDAPSIQAMRSDELSFLFTDTLRHRIMLKGVENSNHVYALNSMQDSPEKLFDVEELDARYDGWLEYACLLPDGNYLLYEGRVGQPRRIWKLWPDAKRLELVFNFRNRYQYLKYTWGLEFDNKTGNIYMSEYGISPDNPIDPEDSSATQHLGYKGGATKIFVSRDFGETWEEFYDFRTRDDILYERFHIHGIHFDQLRDRLYVTTGDHLSSTKSNKRIWWTSDGKKWDFRDYQYFWGDTNDAYSHGQMVSFYVGTDFIVAGGDDYQNCLYRIPLSPDGVPQDLQRVYYYDKSLQGKISQYTSRFRRLPNGLIVTMLCDGDNFPRRTRLMGTYDGLTWFELFSTTIAQQNDNLRNVGLWDIWEDDVIMGVEQVVNGACQQQLIQLHIPSL